MPDIDTAPKDGTLIRMRVHDVNTLGFWHVGGWVYVGIGGLDGELSPVAPEAIETW